MEQSTYGPAPQPPPPPHQKKTKQETAVLAGLQGRCLPGQEPGGTRRSAVTAERTETDIRQGGFGVPARVRRGVWKDADFIHLIYFHFFVFLPVALAGFFWDCFGAKAPRALQPRRAAGQRQTTNKLDDIGHRTWGTRQ